MKYVTTIISILQRKTLRFREFRWLAQSHTARACESWNTDSNLDLLITGVSDHYTVSRLASLGLVPRSTACTRPCELNPSTLLPG